MLYATSCQETEQHNFPFLYQISFSRFGPGLLFPWGSFAWEVESRAYQGMPSWGNFFLLFSKYRRWPFYLMPCFFFFFVSRQQVRPSNTGRWGKYIVFFIFKLLWTEIIWLQNTSGQSKKFNLALNKATPSLSYVFFSIYPPSFAQIYLPYLWLFPRLFLTGI